MKTMKKLFRKIGSLWKNGTNSEGSVIWGLQKIVNFSKGIGQRINEFILISYNNSQRKKEIELEDGEVKEGSDING